MQPCKTWDQPYSDASPNGECSLVKGKTNCTLWGSGGGSVGKVVTSDTGGPQFESRHLQSFYWILFTVNCIVKTKKEKEAGNCPFV